MLVAVLIVVLSAAAVVVGRRAAPHRAGRRQHATGSRSRLATAAATSGLSVPAVTGIRFALEPGSDRDPAPVRSAMLGGVLATVALVATGTFGASHPTLVSHPALYGWNWDHELNAHRSPNTPEAP